MPALLALGGNPGPANAINTTVYALRPLDLVDITDKDSADAPGDVFFWLKDHIIKPMHCRVNPTWHQCSEAGTIDVNMVYQEFVVEHDAAAVGNYQSCNVSDGLLWWAPDCPLTAACAHGLGHVPCRPRDVCGGLRHCETTVYSLLY